MIAILLLLLILTLGVISWILTYKCICKRRIGCAISHGVVSIFWLASGLLIVGLTLNFYTYRVLTKEVPVAKVTILSEQKDQYQVKLQKPDGTQQTYGLKGQYWQLSSEILVWKGWLQWLGFSNRYQLKRLSGQYTKLDDEREQVHTVYNLSNDPQGSWGRFLVSLPELIHAIRTVEGSAVFMPMVQGAVYQVNVTTSGLIAIPANAVAREALGMG